MSKNLQETKSMYTPKPCTLKAIAIMFLCVTFFILVQNTRAATYNIADGDVAGLIAAMSAANASPAPNTINLASGGIYTLTAVDNSVNGLPAITNSMTINGNGATIQRSSAAGTPDFRIFHVLTDGTVTFSGLTLSNARGTGDSYNSFLGGGIFNRNSATVNITNCNIIGNSANYGGGIANPSGTLNIINSTIAHNSATHPTDDPAGGNGGGINNGEGTVNITNSTLSDNSSNTAGGGIFQYAGTVNVTNSTITGNSCNGAGGAIHHNDGGTTEVTNSTITGNSSGVYNNGSHAGTATLRNTIVALNTVVDLQGFITSYGHNLLGTTSGVTITPQTGDQFGITAAQLNLGPLTNNGGSTPTFALLCNSVAIDAGDDAVLGPPLSLNTDQRGVARRFDSHVDIGAFEANTCNPGGAQTAIFFATKDNATEYDIFRYEVGPNSSPVLQATFTDPSLRYPLGLTLGPVGELFVVNQGTQGGFISRFLSAASTAFFNGNIPAGSEPTFYGAFKGNELFVVQRFSGVRRFIVNPDGSVTANGQISITATIGEFRGVTVSPWGELFVSEANFFTAIIHRFVFDVNGNAQANGTVTDANIRSTHGMAFSPWGELFVTSPSSHTIGRFTFDPARNASYNGSISGGGLDNPIDLSFAPWGELFVGNQMRLPTPNVPGSYQGISRFTFDAAHVASSNGTITTPLPISGITFSPPPNSAPVARAKDITVSAGSNCQAIISAEQVDDGSSDPDSGDTITLSLDSTGPFSLGPHQVTLTVTDSHNASSSATATVTVVDTTPPSITCPAATLTVSAGTNCLAAIPNVTSNASASDNCSGPVTITQSPAAGTMVGLGPHTITVTATDAANNSSTCSTTFSVLDATAPVTPNLPGSPQSFNWLNVTTSGPTPSARYGHGMVYDSAHSKVIMFGGQNAQGVNNNEVWELDPASNTWTNVTPATGSMPSPRFSFGMAYDVASGRVVIYGGQVSNIGPGIAGDTWEWDPVTHTWIAKPNGSLPTGPRLGCGMAYDPNLHQVILFGGRNFSSFGSTLTRTYAWDGNTWQQLNAPVGPIGRYTHGMATDYARSKVVMFGGYNGNLLGDTWEWNGSTWTLAAPNGSGPFMRSGPGLAYDSGRQRTVLFGGSTGQPAADTWEWNGTSWTQLQTQSSPSARSTSMVYDSAQAKLVMFSGDGFAQLADTWYSQTTSGLPTITGECSASVTPPSAMDGCAGPITGTTTDPTTYNAQGTYTVHWTYNDGNGNTSTQTQSVIVKDTTPPTISCPAPISASAGSSCQAAIPNVVPNVTASDNCTTSGSIVITQSPGAGTMVSLGPHTITLTATDGVNNSSTCSTTFTVSDTTAPVVPNLPGSPQSFNWVNVNTPGSTPSARTGHRMVYDPVRHKVILFGGHDPAVHPSGNYVLTSHLNDIWELDTATNVWTDVTPTTGAMPVGRADFGMAYDVARDKVVIFGGEIDGWLSGDTWEWDPSTRAWEAKPAASTLVYGGLFGAAMAYDPNRHQVILFGGRSYYNWGEGGTWAWDGTNWNNITPGVYPPPRFIHAMATDLARSKVVMFGGKNNSYALTDTWEWDGNAWTQVALSGPVPPARDDPSMAYDAARHLTVLFGGYEHSDNDTWSWDGVAWSLEHPQASPSWRSTAVVYDLSQSKLVLFSGDARADTWYSQTTSGLPTITGECSATVTAPTAMDSCAGPITGTTTDPTTYNAQGTYTVHWTYNDGNGNSSTQTQTVIVNDTTPPTVTAPPNVAATTGAAATSCGVVISDATLGTATASDNCSSVTPIRSGVPAGNNFPVGTTTITYTATDGSGHTTTATQSVTVTDNTPPSITCPANITMVDNVPGSCGASVNPGTPVTSDNCGIASAVGTRSDGGMLTALYPVGATTINWVVTDASGNTASCLQTVTVTNPAPVVSITGPQSGSLYAVNTPVNFIGSFTDNAGDTHSAVWTFDGSPQAGSVDEATHTVSASHTFDTAGVYLVTLTVTDDCGQTVTTNQVSGFDALVVIYDPNAGFVTGGGWINSPAGAYAPNPGLVGKANFGFVSKYQKGANVPDGQTEFQFKVANLNFHSTIYEWLVVAGARAQYKGSGTINGAGNYGFMLTAIDGQINGGGGMDKFRIKIWDKNNGEAVVYDNQMGAGIDGDPTTALAGGSIVIHK